MQSAALPHQDLVLLGGGHSHVALLKRFGMEPMPGVRLTLISSGPYTPYSGMLPGMIAGHYGFDDAHIDLLKLCRFAGARFFSSEARGLDLTSKRVLCANRPPVAFDLLSIDIGSAPRLDDVPGSAENALPIKPIAGFLERWEKIAERVLQSAGKPFRIVVVGGGAGGVELLLAVQHRLTSLLTRAGGAARLPEFHLIADTPSVLPTHNFGVRGHFTRVLAERGVVVHLGQRASKVEPGAVHCGEKRAVPFDVLLWVTSASAAPWLAASGLRTDERGFIAVNAALQSLSHPFVFAAGDVAAVLEHPRPKAGVFAVRQGPPLARNLQLALRGEAPRPFVPQREFLTIISTGNRYAVASKGPLCVAGDWVWRWKNWIDVRWMRQYQELPAMTNTPPSSERPSAAIAAEMRCGGCAAKVGPDILARVRRRLKPFTREDVLIGLDEPDDAAVILPPPGKALLHTVDFFRSFIDDPYLLGRIAANHSLGDIFAMGGEPHSALALAMLPHGPESKVEEDLFQLLAGATEVLTAERTALVGGHTAEGAELAFGLVVNGIADPARLLRKGGMKAGDRLILTKPLGTGTLFAAQMRGQAKARWIEFALATMQQSARAAAGCLRQHHATACTDVTGFGLLGHLLEMVRASGVDVEISLADLPLLDGAAETIRAGLLSSLHPQNAAAQVAIHNLDSVRGHERFNALFDPQTAGGLLASVPEREAEACVAALRKAGYPQSTVVGVVNVRQDGDRPIHITPP